MMHLHDCCQAQGGDVVSEPATPSIAPARSHNIKPQYHRSASKWSTCSIPQPQASASQECFKVEHLLYPTTTSLSVTGVLQTQTQVCTQGALQ
eukprot:657688-Pelagomonas_calceolata.AAC.3